MTRGWDLLKSFPHMAADWWWLLLGYSPSCATEVAWASSQHGDWLSRVSITRESGRGCTAIYDPAGKVHNITPNMTSTSFRWGRHQVLPRFKGKEMDLQPLMGGGKVLEQQCGAKNIAVATFGNYHLLQLELKTFPTREKKKKEGEKKQPKQLTNHTWRLSMPAPISLPLGNLQSVLTANWTGIKHFNSTWLKLLWIFHLTV